MDGQDFLFFNLTWMKGMKGIKKLKIPFIPFIHVKK